MYKNIGRTIKVLAIIFLVSAIFVSFYYGISLIDDVSPKSEFYPDLLELCITIIVVGSIGGLVTSLLLYGFGELIQQTKRLSDTLCPSETHSCLASMRNLFVQSGYRVTNNYIDDEDDEDDEDAIYEAAGAWTCPCGRKNSPYAHTCICGYDRREHE